MGERIGPTARSRISDRPLSFRFRHFLPLMERSRVNVRTMNDTINTMIILYISKMTFVDEPGRDRVANVRCAPLG